MLRLFGQEAMLSKICYWKWKTEPHHRSRKPGENIPTSDWRVLAYGCPKLACSTPSPSPVACACLRISSSADCLYFGCSQWILESFSGTSADVRQSMPFDCNHLCKDNASRQAIRSTNACETLLRLRLRTCPPSETILACIL